MEWFYIDEIDAIYPDAQQIHVDTRDFHILQMPVEETGIPMLKYWATEDNMFSKSEILGLLKTYEIMTGGKGEWRFMKLDDVWAKYLRFYRIGEIEDGFKKGEGIFVCWFGGGMMSNDQNPKAHLLSRTKHHPDNIIFSKDTLNFIEEE